MSIIIPYLFFTSFATTIAVALNKKIDKILPFSFIIPTLILYFSGFTGNLKIGLYINIFASVLWIPIAIHKVINKKTNFKEIVENIFTIGFVIYSLLFIFVCIYHRFSTFNQWDEFSHWGPMVKEMYRLNRFYCVDESLVYVHKDYPPFISLLEVLWCYLSLGFEERFVYRAITMFSVSFIIPLFTDLKKERKEIGKSILLAGLSTLLFLSGFFIDFMSEREIGILSNFASVYTDATVAIFAAYIFWFIYSSDLSKIIDYILLAVLLGSLLMTKQIALAFYLMLIFYTFFDYTFTNIKNKHSLIKFISFALIIPFLLYLSWSMVVNHLGIGGQFSFGDISLQALYNIIFLDQGLAYQLETKSNFINAIFNRSLFRLFDLTYFEISAIIGLLIFLTLKVLGKESNHRTILILITYALGTIGYAFTMFTLYMFSYGEFESVRLASFDRYMGTYLVFAAFLLIFILIYHLLKCDKIIIKMPILAMLCILLPFTFQNNWKYVTISNEYRGYESRYENIELFKQIDAFIQKDDKVLIINNIYDQYIELILNYLYCDYNFDVISVGEDKEYSPEKVNLTYDEWQDLYSEYNYIYTYTTDEEFYQKYWLDKQKEYLFNNRLYAVNDDASLTLVPWNPSPINN